MSVYSTPAIFCPRGLNEKTFSAGFSRENFSRWSSKNVANRWYDGEDFSGFPSLPSTTINSWNVCSALTMSPPHAWNVPSAWVSFWSFPSG